ncbi:MAG: hypothetical protein QM770_11770 [Tepidisphaeraceae bacterium]
MTLTDEAISKGKVLRTENGRAIFAPAGANYEHHMEAPTYAGPIGKPVRVVLRAKARKIYSMPSGGAFVTPILGTPRIIQGRVMTLDETSVTIHGGGARFVVELPTGKDTVDLQAGAIGVGSFVNAVVLPGATLELA